MTDNIDDGSDWVNQPIWVRVGGGFVLYPGRMVPPEDYVEPVLPKEAEKRPTFSWLGPLFG